MDLLEICGKILLLRFLTRGKAMLFQRFLALLDRAISELFRLQSWGDGFEDRDHRWIHFVDFGPTIGVVGKDGRIHTMMSYWSVRHYYDGQGKLLKRISVRKDLKKGERLATRGEIAAHQRDVRSQFSESRGMINF